MVFCTSIQENEKRDNPSPWKSISLVYERTRFDFKLLPILINDICHAGCMYHNLNKYFIQSRKQLFLDARYFSGIHFHEATNNIRIPFRGFPIHPPRPLVFASSALFSWISLSCTLLLFSRTLTQSLCFLHKRLSRDPNQTGVFCSLTLLITLLVNMQQWKHHFQLSRLWASTISYFTVFACLCTVLKRLTQWVYNSVA